MSEIRIITTDPNVQVYKDGILLAGTASGGSSAPGTFPPQDFPAGPPPNADASHTMPWPMNQDKFECTLGQYVQTVRLVVPAGFSTKGKNGWIKVYGWPGGESPLNSRMIKNNIIQRAWFPTTGPGGQGLTTVLQEDFCVAVPASSPMQLWKPGDIIDYQFKSELGIAQPVRCEVFTGEL